MRCEREVRYYKTRNTATILLVAIVIADGLFVAEIQHLEYRCLYHNKDILQLLYSKMS